MTQQQAPSRATGSAEPVARRLEVSETVASENERWVRGLTAQGRAQEETAAALYRILVKMAYGEVRRRAPRFGLTGPELDDVAHEAAADATLVVCRKIDTFRGESRFTTWAYRFVAFEVGSKVNRHFWRRPTVPLEVAEWVQLDYDQWLSPESVVETRDMVSAVHRVFREQLTARQRHTFEAIAVRGVPVQQVAHDLGSNPNAVYKLMFDARRKLRQGLAAAGYLSDVEGQAP